MRWRAGLTALASARRRWGSGLIARGRHVGPARRRHAEAAACPSRSNKLITAGGTAAQQTGSSYGSGLYNLQRSTPRPGNYLARVKTPAQRCLSCLSLALVSCDTLSRRPLKTETAHQGQTETAETGVRQG